MEDQSKKIFSTILMFVGALFVIISGGIFVSQTWHYLPAAVKNLCLALVTVGMFGGYEYTERKTSLSKTPVALYYLGVCFAGFTATAFMNLAGITGVYAIAFALLVMSVPVAIRFFQKRKILDFIFQVILADGMIICFAQFDLWTPGKAILLSGSVLLLLLGLAVSYLKSENEDEAVLTTALIFYAIHAVLNLPFLLVYAFTSKNILIGTVPAIMMAASLTAIYLAYHNCYVRVLQSAGLWIAVSSFCSFVVWNLPDGLLQSSIRTLFFAILLAGLAFGLITNRKEFFVGSIGLGIVLEVIRLTMLYVISYDAYADVQPRLSMALHPFALIVFAALMIRKLWRKEEESRLTGNSYLISWGVMAANTAFALLFEAYACHYALAFFMSILFLQLAALFEEIRLFRCLFHTLAMLPFLGALAVHSVIPMKFTLAGMYMDFVFEYIAVLAGLGIVLLGIIWYDICEGISTAQLVLACVLTGVTLLKNLVSPALPNVLFLACAALIMLVLAVLFKKKGYALNAAITLVIVALYLTKSIWMSIAWWVYLFVAGIGLIIFAIKKEKAE